MRLIDSHLHLTDTRLRDHADVLVARAVAAGVEAMVTVGVGPEDALRAISLAERHPQVWAAAGLHPHHAAQADAEAFAHLEELLDHSRVVAVGEAGLDFHYDHSPRDAQREVFARHLEIAERRGMPLIVHSREADAEMAAMLRGAGSRVRGVLHCFTGGRALLDAALELGWYVSFSGIASFRGYADAELVRAVPEDRLLVETDAPYLTPVPHRGQPNEPAFVAEVVRALAGHRGADAEALAGATAANARRFYALPAES
jgi:TatD DNase family protein